ncbi:MAG: hypothetical protein OXC62_13615 [Aestuariivita sp.]|nr:hypothetical protein [Aestuariivita sp.]
MSPSVAIIATPLPPETLFVVPGRCIRIGAHQGVLGRADSLTVKRVVVLAIFELLLDAAADLKIKMGHHQQIADIKQAVNVAPKQHPVPCRMSAAVATGSDVRHL